MSTQQKHLVTKCLCHKIWLQMFLSQKYVHKMSWQQNIWLQRLITKCLRRHKTSGHKMSTSRNIWSKNIYVKKHLVTKYLRQETYGHKISTPQNIWSQNIYVTKHMGSQNVYVTKHLITKCKRSNEIQMAEGRGLDSSQCRP